MTPESPYPGVPSPGPDPEATGTPVPDGAAAETAPNGGDGTPPPAPHCTVCGAALDPNQAYCLECGSPTPLAPRLRHGTGGLAAVAVGLALLGGGAGALAYAASRDEAPTTPSITTEAPNTASIITVPTTPVPTTQTDSSLPGATTGTTPMDTTGTLPADTTGAGTTGTTGGLPTDTTATTPSGGATTVTGPDATGQTTSEIPSSPATTDSNPAASGTDDWPTGTSGWTVVVSSVHNEAAARSEASKVQSGGQPGGVLFSTDHPPLRPGYWVAFSGVFTTRGEALSHARTLVGSFPGAYPRQVDS